MEKLLGTWSNKPLGNDTAQNWLVSLNNCKDGSQQIENTLRAAIESCVDDASLAEEGIAAAAITAAGSVMKVAGISQDAKRWIEISAFSQSRRLKKLAISVLDSIESNSEKKNLSISTIS